MKLFGKLMITALVLAALLPFTILKGPDGRPLMRFSDIKLPDFGTPEVPKDIKDAMGSQGQDVIYKWRDEKGVLQFTNTPPPEGVEFTAKGYDPDVNLIQSVEIPEPEPTPTSSVQVGEKKNFDLKNLYSPEAIEKLFNDAENVQKLLNDRMKRQEEIFNAN